MNKVHDILPLKLETLLIFCLIVFIYTASFIIWEFESQIFSLKGSLIHILFCTMHYQSSVLACKENRTHFQWTKRIEYYHVKIAAIATFFCVLSICRLFVTRT